MTEKERVAMRVRLQLRAKDDAAIEHRKAEVEKQRQEREALLLEQERTKYGLTKQYKPLSQMVI